MHFALGFAFSLCLALPTRCTAFDAYAGMAIFRAGPWDRTAFPARSVGDELDRVDRLPIILEDRASYRDLSAVRSAQLQLDEDRRRTRWQSQKRRAEVSCGALAHGGSVHVIEQLGVFRVGAERPL